MTRTTVLALLVLPFVVALIALCNGCSDADLDQMHKYACIQDRKVLKAYEECFAVAGCQHEADDHYRYQQRKEQFAQDNCPTL